MKKGLGLILLAGMLVGCKVGKLEEMEWSGMRGIERYDSLGEKIENPLLEDSREKSGYRKHSNFDYIGIDTEKGK